MHCSPTCRRLAAVAALAAVAGVAVGCDVLYCVRLTVREGPEPMIAVVPEDHLKDPPGAPIEGAVLHLQVEDVDWLRNAVGTNDKGAGGTCFILGSPFFLSVPDSVHVSLVAEKDGYRTTRGEFALRRFRAWSDDAILVTMPPLTEEDTPQTR